ncbi:RlmE family RNA methyltransferase [Candidatus Gracilibacteria bacterium]|nr:RlmE family RNA methyltransferase [Candidatus Gracilibacteria bacterium]
MAKAYQVKDPYFLKAKQDGYRARSAYKLLDIQTRFQILRPNQTVLDLGSAPGSFLQVLAKIVGKDGYVFGLDLQPIERFKQTNIKTAVCDILDTVAVDALLESWGITKIDVMTSDLAPNTSGIRDVDQARSVELVEMAFEVAKRILRPNGNFIAKVFQGEDLQLLMPKLKQNFRKVTLFKPPSCRDRSFETFIVCLGKK